MKTFGITYTSAQNYWAEYLRQHEKPGQGHAHLEPEVRARKSQ
jgi:hypothetical protein